MRRTLLAIGAAAVVLAGAAVGVALTRGSGGTDAGANPALPPATASVTRTTLVETKTVAGTLGYGDAVPISAAETGTITWIAPVGSTVKRGEPLFKVDQRPVVHLYGSLPLYRALRPGTTGADVRQLERNLVALGFAAFTVDDTYDWATAAAVRRWQAKLGLPLTGAVEPGQAIFTPGPIRIAARAARVGDAIGGSSVLSYTGTARRVSAKLEVADQALAVRGRAVTVTVPGRRAVKGRIARVGAVALAGTTSAASDARIEVTVTIANQAALGSLDAAPVDVDLVSDRRADVLAVPVAALLALPKGGFGVQVVDGVRTRIVAVKTGMFAAGQVEVSGNGIAEGMRVGVPK